MNILFVTLCPLEANTSVSISNLGLLKGFRDLDHNITIIMPDLDKNASYYDKNNDLSSYNIIRMTNNNLGQKVATINSNSSGLEHKALMMLRKIYLKLNLFDRSKDYINKANELCIYDQFFDIVISTSDPKTSHLFIAKCIKNGLNYGKWIQHWGDPLSGDVSSQSVFPKWYIKRVEHNVIKKCDYSLYVSPFTAEEQKKNHKDLSEKIGFVPLVCDESYSINSECKNSKREGKLTVAFLGDYSSHVRNILPLYNACKNLDFITLIIAGNTDLSLQNTSNIRIYPRLKQSDAKAIENDADVVVSVGNLYGTQIPGKIYYLSASKKVILVTLEEDKKEEMKKYLNSYNRFDIADNTEESISDYLLRLKNRINTDYNTPEILLPLNIAKKVIELM